MKKRWYLLFTGLLILGLLPVLLANFVLPYAIIKPYRPIVSHEQMASTSTKSLSLEVEKELSLALRLFHPTGTEVKGAIILLHGIGSCKEHQYSLAEELATKGWYALAYDARAHGESQGEYCSFGYHEKHDVLKIKTLLQEIIGNNIPMGIWGHSMGASVAVQALALDSTWAFGVILSPFSQLDRIVLDRMEKYSSFRWKPYADYVLEKAGEIAVFNPQEVSPELAAPHIKQPIFLAHGSADKAIHPSHGSKVFNKIASQDKEFYLIEGGGHNNIFEVGGTSFKERLYSFLDQQALIN